MCAVKPFFIVSFFFLDCSLFRLFIYLFTICFIFRSHVNGLNTTVVSVVVIVAYSFLPDKFNRMKQQQHVASSLKWNSIQNDIILDSIL